MKRYISLIMSLMLVFLLLTGCGGNESTAAKSTNATETTQETVADDGILKILAIGNSFSIDSMHLLNEIAQREGSEPMVLGILYKGGCSLKRHAENVKNNTAEYAFYKNDGSFWSCTEGSTMLDGIRNEDWDIITMQQASTDSGMPGTYNDDIQTVMTYVNDNKLNPNAVFAWNMTWAYPQDTTESALAAKYGNDQMTMYNSIIAAVQEKIVTDENFAYIMPVGTAIQNARTSYLEDTDVNRDAAHLSDLGRVIAAYTWYCTLTGKSIDRISLDTVPQALTNSHILPTDMALSDTEKLIIAESVKNAIADPYRVTQSQYTEAPAQ